MLKEAIGTGDTIDAAFEDACKKLGVAKELAKCEVIKEPVKKTLGLFGGSPAEVKASYSVSPARKAADYLQAVLSGMGLNDVKVEIVEEEEGAALTLSGDDIGFIIGHRGETLDALQYLGSLVANHEEEKYYRVTLDVGSFREKRKETLENLGRKMAIRSVKTGRNNSLEPMNPYERRIIHTAVQAIEGAKSWSEGEDLARHVVIGPVDGERFQRKPRFNNDRRGGGRYNNNGPRPQRNAPPRAPRMDPRISETAPVPDSPLPIGEAVPEKKKAEDAPLYGRIEID